MQKALLGLLLVSIILIPIASNAYATFPTVRITSPSLNEVVQSTTAYISGTYSDTNDLEVSVDGGIYQYATVPSGGNWAYTINGLTSGLHHVIVRGIDSSSNTSYDDKYFYIVTSHIALSKFNVIFVTYSESCQRLLKYNMPSSCPPLSSLVPFDTTNGTTAGHFAKDSHGNLYRTNPTVKNFWIFYNGPNKQVCIDCKYDFGNIGLAPVIMIDAVSGFSYVSNPDSSLAQDDTTPAGNQQMLTNGTVNILHDKYVSPDCMSADISFTPQRLADTIYYMNAGCQGDAKINSTAIKVPSRAVDPTSSATWKYFHQLSINLKTTKGNCINQKCNIPDDRWK